MGVWGIGEFLKLGVLLENSHKRCRDEDIGLLRERGKGEAGVWVYGGQVNF